MERIHNRAVEIVLGLADYFGGWGFICRLDDMRGIRLE